MSDNLNAALNAALALVEKAAALDLAATRNDEQDAAEAVASAARAAEIVLAQAMVRASDALQAEGGAGDERLKARMAEAASGLTSHAGRAVEALGRQRAFQLGARADMLKAFLAPVQADAGRPATPATDDGLKVETSPLVAPTIPAPIAAPAAAQPSGENAAPADKDDDDDVVDLTGPALPEPEAPQPPADPDADTVLLAPETADELKEARAEAEAPAAVAANGPAAPAEAAPLAPMAEAAEQPEVKPQGGSRGRKARATRKSKS